MKHHIKRSLPIAKIIEFNKLPIATLDGFTLVTIDSILYLESKNNYTTFYLNDGVKITATKNLGFYEQRLSQHSFVRIHHSFVVNLVHVINYSKADGGKLTLSSNKSLPVSRQKKSQLLSWFK